MKNKERKKVRKKEKERKMKHRDNKYFEISRV